MYVLFTEVHSMIDATELWAHARSSVAVFNNYWWVATLLRSKGSVE